MLVGGKHEVKRLPWQDQEEPEHNCSYDTHKDVKACSPLYKELQQDAAEMPPSEISNSIIASVSSTKAQLDTQ